MLVSHRPDRARQASAAAVNIATRGPASRHAMTPMTVMTTGQGASTNTVSRPSSTARMVATTLAMRGPVRSMKSSRGPDPGT